jgi:hypothetical protein
MLGIMAYAIFWTPTERLRRRVERLRLQRELHQLTHPERRHRPATTSTPPVDTDGVLPAAVFAGAWWLMTEPARTAEAGTVSPGAGEVGGAGASPPMMRRARIRARPVRQ